MAEGLDGRSLGAVWALPFVGILLSIALLPLFAGHFWEHHQGKIAAFWGLCVIVPLGLLLGPGGAAGVLAHMVSFDYVPFILVILALFTVSGGIVVRGNLHGSPGLNTGLLAIGTVLASLIGTTGASMVMIRPILRANDNRRHNVHVVVFFIFLVSNIGGSLTPLGDPPLFLGFLRGVDFFWTTTHLFHETVFAAVLLLAIFFAIDRHYYRKEGVRRSDPTPDSRISLRGGVNFLLIVVIIAAILGSALLDLGAVEIAGLHLKVADLLRDLVLLLVTVASVRFTPLGDRIANGFSWGPVQEVAKLFAGIFVCIIPVMAMLQAGKDGVFAPLVALVSHADGSPNNVAYFWATGILSSFLDNAPTYLVFFQLAGAGMPDGNIAQALMTHGAMTLAAISLGAVYMGANSYIGNAPNFMVYAIARNGGVAMPSFFGYMLWSVGVLVPTFLLVTVVFLL